MVIVNGVVKKISLIQYFCLCSNGIIVVNLNDGDELIGVLIMYGDDDIMLFFDEGKVVCFNEKLCDLEIGEVKLDLEIGEEFYVLCLMGWIVIGVCGIKFQEGQKVVLLIVFKGDGVILIVIENGYGKCILLVDYLVKSCVI